MKFFIVFAALCAIAFARPNAPDGIVRSESDVQPESFKFGVETSDGTQHDAEGHLKDLGTEHEAIVVHGSYSWVDKDGQKYTVTYVADENGYQPSGAHLPVGPEPVIVHGGKH